MAQKKNKREESANKEYIIDLELIDHHLSLISSAAGFEVHEAYKVMLVVAVGLAIIRKVL